MNEEDWFSPGQTAWIHLKTLWMLCELHPEHCWQYGIRCYDFTVVARHFNGKDQVYLVAWHLT